MEAIHATSADPRFPPQNILEPSLQTFWVSTGLFPQELLISLPKPSKIDKLSLWTMKASHIKFEYSSDLKPTSFLPLAQKDIEDSQTVQLTNVQLDGQVAQHLRLRIEKGFGDFVSVHRFICQGSDVL